MAEEPFEPNPRARSQRASQTGTQSPSPPPTLRSRRQLKLTGWPTPDWEFTPWGYRTMKWWLEAPIKGLARLRHKGLENVPMTGPVLVVPNHHSWADPFIIGAVLERPAFYLAKEQLFKNPVLAAFLEAHGQIKVDRERGGNLAAVSTAVELLAGGFVVGVFPEATRSRPGEVKRGKTGVARIALESGAPVVPVGMTTYAVWPKHRALPRFGDHVYVNVGEPVHFEGGHERAKDRDALRAVTDEIMDHVEGLLDEAEAARKEGAAWST